MDETSRVLQEMAEEGYKGHGGDTQDLQESNGPKEAIIKHNLEKLNSDMIYLLRRETMGGNSGNVTIDSVTYPCAAANGFADPKNGKIKAFGNYRENPKDVKIVEPEDENFVLRVAHSNEKGFFNIVNFYGWENFSPEGRVAILQAAKRYNGEHGVESYPKS